MVKLFKKKEQKKEKLKLSKEEMYFVDNFNEWFCNIYDGYDGRIGNKGIFLRLDKLSPNMIMDWFEYLNCEYDSNDEYVMMDKIRENWLNKISDC